MIHVCSLARLYDTVEETGALHIVTLLKDTDRVARPKTILEANHLVLGMDDICVAMDGYVIPCDDHVTRLIEFVRGWDRAKPMVVHCYAGISRSTAAAYIAACLANPHAHEHDLAVALRRAAPLARPNEALVALADAALGRKGRMSAGIATTGRDLPWPNVDEGVPFGLPLAIWLLKGFYDNIPVQLEQAARIDGATRLQAFILIVMPLSVPGIIAAAIYSFIGAWNEYIYAYTFLSKNEQLTLPVGIQRFFSENTTDFPGLMAASFMMSVPVVVLFLVLQKYFVRALTEGAVKH
jgi:predicted protein tyrosine phosphatase